MLPAGFLLIHKCQPTLLRFIYVVPTCMELCVWNTIIYWINAPDPRAPACTVEESYAGFAELKRRILSRVRGVADEDPLPGARLFSN
jgi:hypothetical protein